MPTVFLPKKEIIDKIRLNDRIETLIKGILSVKEIPCAVRDLAKTMTRPFYLDVISTLNNAGVRYTVVGGVATILHGSPRMTGDLDLAVILETGNLLKLADAMNKLGYKPKIPVDPKDLAKSEIRGVWKKEKGMRVFTFFHPKKPFAEVDILIEQETDFLGIWKRRVTYQAGEVSVPTASIDDLIKMKSLSARDKDLADINALNRIKALKEKEGWKIG